MTSPVTVAIVVPSYNEEEALPETARQLLLLRGRLIEEGLLSPDSYLLFTDDGSRDATWRTIAELVHREEGVRGLKLSRNFGHQNALLAGLMHAATADATVSIDADLQDDPQVIREMVLKFCEGYDVVYGVRSDRQTDSWRKRTTAQGFYKLMSRLGVESVYNHADYRLLSRRALAALGTFKEVNLYLRGLVPLVGFRHTTVEYVRAVRVAGESKYPLRKMLSFAWNGITSFSTRPLRYVTWLGFSVAGVSIGLTLYALGSLLFFSTVPGWASTVIPIYFLGGIQLLCIGIVGEYLGKIYAEVKGRPRFIIEETVGDASPVQAVASAIRI